MLGETHRVGRRELLRMATIAAIGVPIGGVAHGQEPTPREPSGEPGKLSEKERRRVRWMGIIKEYSIVAHAKSDTRLDLKTEPILRWTNPVRNGDDGMVFLWLKEARPQAVVCVYRVFERGRWLESHEFKSLSPDPLTATRRQDTIWATRAAGLTWKPIPGAPPPASTPADRLRQLRAQAREFRLSIDVDKKKDELRLLPHPVYRSERNTDGAVFAYAMATDPEAWLLIEERRDQDKPAWYYAFARMTSHPMVATRAEAVAWEVTREFNYTDPSATYFVTWSPAPIPEP